MARKFAKEDDVTIPLTVLRFENETWHTCPKCGKEWRDAIATPGLLHRTVVCGECKSK
jgi:predicted RNA-binding Zn-ribbon protein involved in translation (DUF1610 family)